VLLEHEIETASDQFLHCRVLLGSKHAQLLRALGREEAGNLARLLLGSRVVRLGRGSWAEGIWCASRSGSS